jgi:hypothetical protein
MAVNFQAVKPRSQLAANQLLIRLGQVFGGATFTSRQASNALGYDFLYTAKKLSRMRKNNVLNVAAKETRVWGGYENRYKISTHGFRKINYLTKRGLSGEIPTTPKPDMIEQSVASQYLLHGTGTVKELLNHGLVKIATRGVQIPPVTDELGMLLFSLDPTFIPMEVLFGETIKQLPGASYGMVAARAARLQELGYVPKEITPLLFVANGMLRGCTESLILLDLVLRGSIQLKAENEALRETTSQNSFLQTGSLKCQNCLDYRLLLIEEKYKSMLLKTENDLLNDKCTELQQKLWEASEKALWDRFSHWQQLTYMERRIERLFECLVIISKWLNEYPNDDPFVVLMRGFVQDSFIIMAAMNRFARDPYSET